MATFLLGPFYELKRRHHYVILYNGNAVGFPAEVNKVLLHMVTRTLIETTEPE